jgi:hypothetical protein
MAETHGLNVRLANCRKQPHPHPSSSGFRSKSRLVVTVEDHSAIHLQNPYFCDAFATTALCGADSHNFGVSTGFAIAHAGLTEEAALLAVKSKVDAQDHEPQRGNSQSCFNRSIIRSGLKLVSAFEYFTRTFADDHAGSHGTPDNRVRQN